jgi:hypothetical protein
MALSAEIYGRFMPKSVADFDAEYEQGQASKQARELNALRLLSGQRQEREAVDASARDNALRGLVGGFGADENANALSLLRGGHLEAAQKYQKANTDRQKDAAEAKYKAAQADKERIAGSLQKLEAIGQLMGGVSDQATYDQARQQAAATFGPEFMAQVPPVYDPARIAQAQQQAMSVKERLEQEWKAKGYALDVRKQGEVERSNVTREGETARSNRADEATARGQLGVAQGNLGVSRQRLALDSAAPKGVLDPERGLLVDPRTGEARPITVGGKAVGAKSTTGNATESERTAGFLLQRVRDSQRQLAAAVKDEAGAAKPGIVQEGARLLSEPLANTMTGQNRQRVESAQLDILDAALTLGTGAAYTREQLQGYRKSYFPQIGDSDKAVADKEARLQNLIRAAETKAGRSAADTAPNAPAGGPAASTGGWKIELVK